jgi:hypothetical protein
MRTELRACLHALPQVRVNERLFGTLFANRIMLDRITEMSGPEPCTRAISWRRMNEA